MRLLLAVLLFASACTSRSQSPADAADVAAAPAPASTPARTATFERLSFDAESLPESLEYRGKITTGAKWRDTRGENVLILTQTGAFPSTDPKCDECRSAELYGHHFVLSGGAWTQLWRITDFVRDCPFDLYAGFVGESLTLTDLDQNGVAETTFQYTLACRSDVSPATRKLLMHQGAAKYAIRGTTDLAKKTGQAEYGGGERNVDPAFEKAPPALRAHAQEQWDRFVAQDDFASF